MQYSCAMVDQLGPAVQLLRKRRGLRQRDLAEAAGLGRTTVVQLEGGGANATWDTLCRVLLALGATLLDLHEAILLTSAQRGWEGEGEEGLQGGVKIEGIWMAPDEVERRIDAAFDRLVERTTKRSEVSSGRGGDER